MNTIDLNADLGEHDGEAPLYALIASANVACGGHAGDDGTMAEAVRRCLAAGVAIGAHPSYPDRAGFGRSAMSMTPAALSSAVTEQIAALSRIAEAAGASIGHIKPHGALYNTAARDAGIAEAIAEGVARVSRDLVLVGLAGSPALAAWRTLGFRVAAEGFADRAYEPDGSLRPRYRPGALIEDPAAAAEQAVRLASAGGYDTICVHSDTPGAAAILAAVRRALELAGFVIRPLHGTTGRA